MLNWNTDDTICAIASGLGGANRGIVRLSGPAAIDIADQLVRRDATSLSSPSRSASIEYCVGEIWLGQRLGWLSGFSFWWRTSKSYTGQPAVEFHLLGSLPILEALVTQCCTLGARIAQPGEFTLRAFLANRIDLTQAEAVLGVINARGEQELQNALHQLAGGLAKPIAQLRAELINALAHLEAGLDFVDEDIEFISAHDLRLLLLRSADQVQQLLTQIQSRNAARGNPKVVLIGRPNAGKSSLLNALANDATAIVSPQRGTTRDYVSITLTINNMDVEIIDTAGLDDALDSEIDAQSQTQTRSQIDNATLTLFVVDGASQIAHEIEFLERTTTLVSPFHRMMVINKRDLLSDAQIRQWEAAVNDSEPSTKNGAFCLVSAHYGNQIDTLRELICQRIQELVSDEGMGMLPNTAQRCRDSLQRCAAALEGAIEMTLQPNLHEELIAAEIRLAMEELGWIAGEVYTDDLLDRIFSQFCIGK